MTRAALFGPNSKSASRLDKWDDWLFDAAELVARMSKDPERKVGAVLTLDRGRALYTGYNGLPTSFPPDAEVTLPREEKLLSIVHAEVNAVLHAPSRVEANWYAYITSAPCASCASVLVAFGATRLVTRPPESSSSWRSSQERGLQVLRAAGVEVVHVVTSRRQ